MTTAPAPTGLSRTASSGVGLGVCVALNYLIAYAIFTSPYGSVFFMSDDSRGSTVWVPLIVGVVVGCVESVSFGFRIAVGASVFSVVLGVVFFLLLGTLVLGAVGGAAGWVAGWTLSRWASSLVPVSRLLLGAVVVAASISIVSDKVTAPGDEDFALVHTPSDGPAVLVRVDGAAYPPSITGRLANVDGCPGIVDASPVAALGTVPQSVIEDSAPGRAVVIWPPGTTIRSDPYSVSSQGRTYHLGDEVTVGGGWVHLIEEDLFYDQTPQTCLSNIFIY